MHFADASSITGPIRNVVFRPFMPTLFRFLVFCAVIVGLVYGAMFALIMTVKPVEREVTIRIPANRINPTSQ